MRRCVAVQPYPVYPSDIFKKNKGKDEKREVREKRIGRRKERREGKMCDVKRTDEVGKFQKNYVVEDTERERGERGRRGRRREGSLKKKKEKVRHTSASGTTRSNFEFFRNFY